MEQAKMQLSIVVNMYNTASFLPRCMETLLDQDIPTDSYEIILVDDGSTDNSLELAKEYATQSTSNATMPTIRVEYHANKGLAGARNTGLKVANGKYLCFVDPDDYIEKHSLSALLRQMENEQLDMLRFNYQKIDEEGNVIADSEMEVSFDYSSKIMTGKEFMVNRLTTTCYVWAYIYRLEIIKKNNIRFIEGCYFDDVPWLPRVLQKVERINCVSVRHQYYLQRNGSLVHTINRDAILRKINGQLGLIDILVEQQKDADIQLLLWYKMMLAHVCISVLTSVALWDYKSSCKYIDKIKQILPISTYRATKKLLKKILLFNFSPKLYMWMIHMKNRKRLFY